MQPSRLHYPPSFLFRFGVLFRLLFHFLLKDRAVLLSPHLRPHCILRHTHAHTHTQRVKDTGALWSGIGVKCAGMHGTHLKIGLPASHFMCSFSLNANNSGIMASRQAQSTKQQNQRHCVCVCIYYACVQTGIYDNVSNKRAGHDPPCAVVAVVVTVPCVWFHATLL